MICAEEWCESDRGECGDRFGETIWVLMVLGRSIVLCRTRTGTEGFITMAFLTRATKLARRE